MSHRLSLPLLWFAALLLPKSLGFLGGLGSLLNPFGGGGGIANDNNTTNATHSDSSITLGNEALMNTGTMNITNTGTSLAALEAGNAAMNAALEANSNVLNRAFDGIAGLIAGAVSLGGSAAPVSGSAGFELNSPPFSAPAAPSSPAKKMLLPGLLVIGAGLAAWWIWRRKK
jgi:hypothetical protein